MRFCVSFRSYDFNFENYTIDGPVLYLMLGNLMFHLLLTFQQVNTYRSMLHNDMMVGAFSHSTAVGKLRQELPDVPSDARLMFPRYTLEEAETVCHYYMR